MFQVSESLLFDDKKINIGKKFKIIGEIRYGVAGEKFDDLLKVMEKIKVEYLSNVIIFDFSELKRWDSLGIRAIVPIILDLNQKLKRKGRMLISVVGDKEADTYAAVKDKYPDISDEIIPWHKSYDEAIKALDN